MTHATKPFTIRRTDTGKWELIHGDSTVECRSHTEAVDRMSCRIIAARARVS